MSDHAPTTVTQLVTEQAQRRPEAAAFSYKRDGQWQSLTWLQVDQLVRDQADHLRRLGLAHGDRIGICGPPSWQWQVMELAAYRLGAVVVGIETRATPDQIAHILALSRIKILATLDSELPSKLPPADQHGLASVIQIPSDARPDLSAAQLSTGQDTSDLPPASTDQVPPPAPADPATLVFTSGTTGTPKAIQYSHAQLAIARHSLCQAFPELAAGGKYICWLPMAHMFQRMMNYVAMAQNGQIFFQQDPREILTCLKEVQPEFFIAVPRLYEKLYEGIQTELAVSNPLRRVLAKTAIHFGIQHARNMRHGRKSNLLTRQLYSISEQLVLRRIRTLLGGRLRYMMTGSAPMAPHLLEFFHGLGWLVLEAYGVSENAVPMTVNRPQRFRFGSVGQPLPENQIRIADDHEVLVRGPGVFSGYVGDTSSEQPFTPEGFYRTGDLGHFDEEGFLYLTGRKKEIIKTSTGRRISPSKIERVYQQCPLVDQVVVVGNGQKHLAALVTPADETPQLDDEQRAARKAAILTQFRSLDGDLETHEQVRAISLLDRRFSVSRGELTPSLKIRRNVIAQRFASVIDALYS